MSSKLEMWLLPAAAEAGMVELFVVPPLGRRNPATPPEAGRPVNRAAAALGSVWAVLREGSGGAGSGGGSAIWWYQLLYALLLHLKRSLALLRVVFAAVLKAKLVTFLF